MVVVVMVLITAPGAFAKDKHGRSGVRVRPSQSVQEFLKALNGPPVDELQCDIYCDGAGSEPTTTTFPGTVSGCLADCGEICGGPCVILD
jgi:hypothetical protein